LELLTNDVNGKP